MRPTAHSLREPSRKDEKGLFEVCKLKREPSHERKIGDVAILNEKDEDEGHNDGSQDEEGAADRHEKQLRLRNKARQQLANGSDRVRIT